MEIKQKGRSLSDAIQTIDSLRKSIIELQFQNEGYNTKLGEKEKEKEETEQKLNTVREMAHALRDQMVHLEGQIEQGKYSSKIVVWWIRIFELELLPHKKCIPFFSVLVLTKDFFCPLKDSGLSCHCFQKKDPFQALYLVPKP